jgi:hypothetical protein
VQDELQGPFRASVTAYFFSPHIGNFWHGTGLPEPFAHTPPSGARQLEGPKSFASNDAMQHRVDVAARATQHSCFAPQSSKAPDSACSFLLQASRQVPPIMEQDSEAGRDNGSAGRMIETTSNRRAFLDRDLPPDSPCRIGFSPIRYGMSPLP